MGSDGGGRDYSSSRNKERIKEVDEKRRIKEVDEKKRIKDIAEKKKLEVDEKKRIKDTVEKERLEEINEKKRLREFREEIHENLGNWELQEYFRQFSIEKQITTNIGLEIRPEFKEFIKEREDIAINVKERLIEKYEKINENHTIEKFLIYATKITDNPKEFISEYEEHTGMKLEGLKSEYNDKNIEMSDNINDHLAENENINNSIIVRDKCIYVETLELEKIRGELKEKEISLRSLRKEVGLSFENLYHSRANSMNEESLKKLESILEREIPHNVELGAIKECNLVKDTKLAELTTILLGDGGLYKPPDSKRNIFAVTLNGVDEKKYVNYVKDLMSNLLQTEPSISPRKNEKAINLRYYGKGIVDFFESIGIPTGDKVKNQVDVPKWIKENQEFIGSGLKGLFDTDGTISLVKRNKSFILGFKNASYPLVKSFKEMCESLDIQTQPKIVRTRVVNKNGEVHHAYHNLITSKSQIKKFLDVINPQKWKDQKRRDYIGMNLILLKSNAVIQENVLSKLKERFPKNTDRRYSIDYAKALKEICIENGCIISRETIEEALIEALLYKYPNRDKKAS